MLEKVKIFAQYADGACDMFLDGLCCSMAWGRGGIHMNSLSI